MKVSLLDLTPQNGELENELNAAFHRVLHSGQYILGREVEEFERSAALQAGTRHAIGVSSGTDAILLALMAMGIGAGDEVICPSFTFFATAGCVARAGATAVFADSCPVCFNIDPREIESRITERTKAIIPVHLFGQPAEMDTVMQIAGRHGLAIIEDAAQAFGAVYRGRAAGSIGSFGTFSFFPSKNLGGFGDAGLLVTNDDGLAEQARILRTHGAKPKYIHKFVGGNFRIDALQAALLGVKLPHLGKYSEQRRSNARYYTRQLEGTRGVWKCRMPESRCLHGGGAETASTHPERAGIVLPEPYEHNQHIWNQYTLRVRRGPRWEGAENPRERLRKYLADREIGSEIYYPRPLHKQECFSAWQKGSTARLPVCEELADECLSIPIYPELGRQRQDQVIGAIQEFVRENL